MNFIFIFFTIIKSFNSLNNNINNITNSIKLNNTSLNYIKNAHIYSFSDEAAPGSAMTDPGDSAPFADYFNNFNKKIEKPDLKENKYEDKKAPEPFQKESDVKKEFQKKSIADKENIKDQLIESFISTTIRSSLKNSRYLKNGNYTYYAKKISKEVSMNLGIKLLFIILKGKVRTVVQLWYFVISTFFENIHKTLIEGIFNTILFLIKIFIYGFLHKLSKKISKKLIIKSILYGIFTYLIEILIFKFKPLISDIIIVK